MVFDRCLLWRACARQVRKQDFAVWVTSFVGTLLLGVQLGLAIAIGASRLRSPLFPSPPSALAHMMSAAGGALYGGVAFVLHWGDGPRGTHLVSSRGLVPSHGTGVSVPFGPLILPRLSRLMQRLNWSFVAQLCVCDALQVWRC
jgi:hypothetical protein